jgi:hypothetical protein
MSDNDKSVLIIILAFIVAFFAIAMAFGEVREKEITRRLQLEVQLQELKNQAQSQKVIPPTNVQPQSDKDKVDSVLKNQADLDKFMQSRGNP